MSQHHSHEQAKTGFLLGYDGGSKGWTGEILQAQTTLRCSQECLHAIVMAIYAKTIIFNANSAVELVEAADFLQVSFMCLFSQQLAFEIRQRNASTMAYPLRAIYASVHTWETLYWRIACHVERAFSYSYRSAKTVQDSSGLIRCLYNIQVTIHTGGLADEFYSEFC